PGPSTDETAPNRWETPSRRPARTTASVVFSSAKSHESRRLALRRATGGNARQPADSRARNELQAKRKTARHCRTTPCRASADRRSRAAIAITTRAMRSTRRERRSARERHGEAGDQLDQVGLPAGAGLGVEPAEMRLDGSVGDAERGRDLR